MMSILVAQIGARLHYGAARALGEAGLLDSLVTDLQSQSKLFEFFLPGLARYKVALGDAPVYHRNVDGLVYKAMLKLAKSNETWMHDFASERLARHVLEVLRERNPKVVYGFDTALLPIMSADHQRSERFYVLEQCIAPRATQVEVFKRLREISGGNEFDAIILAASRQDAIERKEWALVDRIVCPSRFVGDSLVDQGCESDKIVVVPYGFSPKKPPNKDAVRTLSEDPLAIFVGAVSYRKGAQDLLDIAKALQGRVRIKAIGPVQVSGELYNRLDQHVDLVGPVAFEEVQKFYESADFLIHPSYIEGSATVVYEALSFGMPCFVTTATGSVVEAEKGGFEFAPGDVASCVARIESMLDDPNAYREMSSQALALGKDYTIEKYADRLVNALADVWQAS